MRNVLIKSGVGCPELLQKENMFENKLEIEINECNSHINGTLDRIFAMSLIKDSNELI